MKLITNLLNRWNSLRTKLTPENNWITIYQSTDEYAVRIRKLQIEDNHIPVIMFDQRDSSYNAFGYIYLKVEKHNEEKSVTILNSIDE